MNVFVQLVKRALKNKGEATQAIELQRFNNTLWIKQIRAGVFRRTQP
ncbi:hypothetical protein [Cohnella hongkongensis]|uniref:Uncharacterized protein n=1 Tax=Cohnella hongkongensis TaxID=178337 RepID=A0ABV9FN21_9BACL